MWMNGRRTKTNSKTSPEQSEINKTNCSITRKTAPPPGGHETNVLNKFHENLAKHVTSRVFTCFHYIYREKNASPTGGHVFHRSGPFSNSSEISIKTNVLSNFHDDLAKIVTSSVFTRKTTPPTGDHVFQRTRTTFELNQHIIKTNILTNFQLHRDIIGTNLLTNFHEDRTKNVASRVFTRTRNPQTKIVHRQTGQTKRRLYAPPKINLGGSIKTAPPTGSHVFLQTRTTFELNQHIIKTNILTNFELDRDIIGTKLLTKFHEDWKRNVPSRKYTLLLKTASPPGNHVFQRTGTIFELNSHIKDTNVLTKFHENWAKNVTSRVFTCFHYIHIEKNALPTGGHVFSPIWTIFELIRDINKTNVLTNLNDDWAKIVTSRVFTKKTAPPTGGHVFQRTGTTFKLNQHIIKTNILTNFEVDQEFIGTKLLTKFH
ncbi:hypothetical protein DPMN_088470 [Dreissena polymorpha]|uniref:Uncharacterized protein n=1 Tax=Dreissena polymorpha TaxID=45954 RepID=A0A9D4KU52_DREPO|nr:hypothetical protein DPMN_088470 [Dreissena polymorpha]